MTLGDVLNGNISTSAVSKLFDTQSIENINNNNFEKTLTDAINEVNKAQETSYNAMSEIATGEVKNLQEAVVKIEKAELNLRLALEVKNKTLSAYKEIMRMQL